MNISTHKTTVKTLLLLAIALFVTAAPVASETESSSLGNVVIPKPATPLNEQQCVEPTEVMRRDHMKFLLHQRDETVLDGIRTEKYSLIGCINCHAQASEDGKIVRAEDSEYFCTACHEYASVKIDCFECHSDRPEASAVQANRNFSTRQLLARIDSIELDDRLGSQLHKMLLRQVDIRDE